MIARRRIAVVGFVATAVTFGPGRMAYGMFLPRLREDFGLGSGMAGTIAGAAFAAFFLALFVTGWLMPRVGPRLPVLLAGGFATAGFALVASASGVIVLAAGVALASASAGFAWTPFNAMAERAVPPRHQKRVLSIVSTGTSFGIVAAGLLAFGLAVARLPWTVAWWTFAAVAPVVGVAPLLLLSRADGFGRGGRLDLPKVLARLRCRAARPLYGLAISFGASNAVYLSFWIDHVAATGGLPGLSTDLAGPVLFVAFGLAGCLGLFTGDVAQKIGLRALLAVLYAASAVSLLLLASVPGSWAGVLVSASLQGVCLMALSAVYSFWSESLFPDMPSASFTAVLMLYALGNALSPPLAGLLGDAIGLGTTLAVFGGLSLASLLLVRRVEEV